MYCERDGRVWTLGAMSTPFQRVWFRDKVQERHMQFTIPCSFPLKNRRHHGSRRLRSLHPLSRSKGRRWWFRSWLISRIYWRIITSKTGNYGRAYSRSSTGCILHENDESNGWRKNPTFLHELPGFTNERDRNTRPILLSRYTKEQNTAPKSLLQDVGTPGGRKIY